MNTAHSLSKKGLKSPDWFRQKANLMSATIPPSLYSPCYPLFSPFAGVAQPVPKVRDRAAGPHPVVVRAGGAAQPRPHGPRLLARGEDDAQQAQVGHQVQTEEGRINNRVFHWVVWSVVLINRVLCLVYKNGWLGFQSLCVQAIFFNQDVLQACRAFQQICLT